MNRRSPRGLFAVIALSSALATITGCSTSQSVGSYVDDTVITTKVKAKFAETKDVDAATIGVETINGMLRGKAKSPQEKTQAETLARSVDGVKAVNNRIDVTS